MLESLEKLREWLDYKINRFNARTNAIVLNTGVHPDELYVIADEIEAEIAERYILLPVDANNEPIRVGDKITLPNGSRDKVRFITIREHDVVFNEHGWVPSQCTHAKPRTVEDVLDDLMNDDAWDKTGEYEEIKREIIAKYAAEIRELMEVGE